MPFRNTNCNGYSWMIIYGAHHLRSPLANDYETQSEMNSSCFFTWGKTYLQNIIWYYEKLTSLCYLSRGLNGEDISFFFQQTYRNNSIKGVSFCLFQTNIVYCGNMRWFLLLLFFWLLNITYNGNYQETEIFSWFLKRLFTW